jgi:hypothetical protein
VEVRLQLDQLLLLLLGRGGGGRRRSAAALLLLALEVSVAAAQAVGNQLLLLRVRAPVAGSGCLLMLLHARLLLLVRGIPGLCLLPLLLLVVQKLLLLLKVGRSCRRRCGGCLPLLLVLLLPDRGRVGVIGALQGERGGREA